jgi:hypothetical protein
MQLVDYASILKLLHSMLYPPTLVAKKTVSEEKSIAKCSIGVQ